MDKYGLNVYTMLGCRTVVLDTATTLPSFKNTHRCDSNAGLRNNAAMAWRSLGVAADIPTGFTGPRVSRRLIREIVIEKVVGASFLAGFPGACAGSKAASVPSWSTAALKLSSSCSWDTTEGLLRTGSPLFGTMATMFSGS